MKKSADRKFEKYKARLVVKRYSQETGIDYDEVFSPVIRQSTLKIMFILAVEFDFEIELMDVITQILKKKYIWSY